MRKRRKSGLRAQLGVSAALVALLFLLPLCTVLRREAPPRPSAGEQEPERITLLPPGEKDSGDTIRLLLGEEVEELSLSDYLRGVLRAEMPASFAQEALCAQAVAARTYTLYKLRTGGNHQPDADICADPTCCQAYLDAASAAANWGENAENYEAKLSNAVSATDGQVLLYGGQPILAVFHSSSAGYTKSAGEVWTGDVPYLRSVATPEGGEIPNYYSRVELSPEDLRAAFAAAHPEADFSPSPSEWVKNLTYTEGANVDRVDIGGVSVRGPEVRALFGLRSASFDVEYEDGEFVFYVTGYGHGVGMSQYGANALAKEGKTWREIVTHYYTGVTVAPYD